MRYQGLDVTNTLNHTVVAVFALELSASRDLGAQAEDSGLGAPRFAGPRSATGFREALLQRDGDGAEGERATRTRRVRRLDNEYSPSHSLAGARVSLNHP
jgi:hypothetical protein